MADNAADQRQFRQHGNDPPPMNSTPGEPAGDARSERGMAGGRAHRRAAEAGVRVLELGARLASLRSGTGDPDTLERSTQAAARAVRCREEAVLRDVAAHEASARAHTRAATAYEHLAATVPPQQRAEYIRKARVHRRAAATAVGL
jgi:hypothetical protein